MPALVQGATVSAPRATACGCATVEDLLRAMEMAKSIFKLVEDICGVRAQDDLTCRANQLYGITAGPGQTCDGL